MPAWALPVLLPWQPQIRAFLVPVVQVLLVQAVQLPQPVLAHAPQAALFFLAPCLLA
jgi:hypothetical protein